MTATKPKHKLTVGSEEFDLSQGLAVSKQKWRKHLVLVSTSPSLLLGLVEEPPKKGEPFTLYHALDYAAQYRFEPTRQPQKGALPPLRAICYPQVIMGWDMMGPITIDVHTHNYVMCINEQVETVRSYFFEGYQHCFAPSKLVKPPGSAILDPNSAEGKKAAGLLK